MAEIMANATIAPPTVLSYLPKSSSTLGIPINDIASVLLSYLHLWIMIGSITYLIYKRYFTGIAHIPGPFIASVSNLWKIKAAWQEAMPQQNIALHKKHGSLVRIGHNMVSVDDPAALSMIYGFKPIYLKVFPLSSSGKSISERLQTV